MKSPDLMLHYQMIVQKRQLTYWTNLKCYSMTKTETRITGSNCAVWLTVKIYKKIKEHTLHNILKLHINECQNCSLLRRAPKIMSLHWELTVNVSQALKNANKNFIDDSSSSTAHKSFQLQAKLATMYNYTKSLLFQQVYRFNSRYFSTSAKVSIRLGLGLVRFNVPLDT